MSSEILFARDVRSLMRRLARQLLVHESSVEDDEYDGVQDGSTDDGGWLGTSSFGDNSVEDDEDDGARDGSTDGDGWLGTSSFDDSPVEDDEDDGARDGDPDGGG